MMGENGEVPVNVIWPEGYDANRAEKYPVVCLPVRFRPVLLGADRYKRGRRSGSGEQPRMQLRIRQHADRLGGSISGSDRSERGCT